MKASGDLAELVSALATESLETGDPPAELSERVDYRALSRGARGRLMRVGLAQLVGHELYERRTAEWEAEETEAERAREERERAERERMGDPAFRRWVMDLHQDVACRDHGIWHEVGADGKCEYCGQPWPCDSDRAHRDFAEMYQCVKRFIDEPDEERRRQYVETWRRIHDEYAEKSAERQREIDELNAKARRCFEQAIEEEVRNALSSIGLAGADGRMRSLYDFTLADVDYWRSRASHLAVSWREREDWFTDVAKALGEAGVSSIGELPPDQAKGLADRAIAVWKTNGSARPNGNGNDNGAPTPKGAAANIDPGGSSSRVYSTQ